MSPHEIQPLEQIFARIDVESGSVEVVTCFTLTHLTQRFRERLEEILREMKAVMSLEFTDGFVHLNIVLDHQQHGTLNAELVGSLRFVLSTLLCTRNNPSAIGEMPNHFLVRGQHSMQPELPKHTHPELLA